MVRISNKKLPCYFTPKDIEAKPCHTDHDKKRHFRTYLTPRHFKIQIFIIGLMYRLLKS